MNSIRHVNTESLVILRSQTVSFERYFLRRGEMRTVFKSEDAAIGHPEASREECEANYICKFQLGLRNASDPEYPSIMKMP